MSPGRRTAIGVAVLFLIATACAGRAQLQPRAPEQPAPPESVTTARSAGRLLDQASWGPTPDAITQVRRMGISDWLDWQFSLSESDLPDEFVERPWAHGLAIAGESLRWVVITRGEHGAHAWSPEGCLSVPAPRVQVVDTTGAGDVFAAGLVHALALGRPMQEALQTAVAWGSATVTCLGVPGPEAIRELA